MEVSSQKKFFVINVIWRAYKTKLQEYCLLIGFPKGQYESVSVLAIILGPLHIA